MTSLINRFVGPALAAGIALLASTAVSAVAKEEVETMLPPDQVVKQATDRVLRELTENRDQLEMDRTKLYQLVYDIILPNIDFERISRMILAKHWRAASPEQRTEFMDQFTTLLIRTYATALYEYNDQKIVYKPFNMKEGADRVSVRAEFVPTNGPKVPFSYSLTNRNNDRWRVYDIKIDGISLVKNYRTSYGAIIQSEGLDGLIQSLKDKNAELQNTGESVAEDTGGDETAAQ